MVGVFYKRSLHGFNFVTVLDQIKEKMVLKEEKMNFTGQHKVLLSEKAALPRSYHMRHTLSLLLNHFYRKFKWFMKDENQFVLAEL